MSSAHGPEYSARSSGDRCDGWRKYPSRPEVVLSLRTVWNARAFASDGRESSLHFRSLHLARPKHHIRTIGHTNDRRLFTSLAPNKTPRRSEHRPLLVNASKCAWASLESISSALISPIIPSCSLVPMSTSFRK